MDKTFDIIKKALQESINNYPSYRKNFQSIFSLLKENIKYEKILKYYNPEKDEKYFKLFYLFLLQHRKWINPHNINIYCFQEHFKIKKSVYNDNLEQQVFNDVDKQKMIKIFIYWYFYLLMNFENNLNENDNVINNDELKKILVFNEIKNILLQTNNKIINFYKIKKINIEEVFIFLYTYIFWIEYYTKITLHEKDLKPINTKLFELLYDLIQKISLKILTEIESIDQFKDNIKIFYSFLDELKSNELIHNDYNIIILLDNNIIQTFVENILISIRPKLLEGVFPNYSDNLADFYSSFVKFRFNKSKLMDFLINSVKNSFVNLRYFCEEKEKIVNDIFIQKFQSDLLQKIFNQESFKSSEHPNFHSFLFNGNDSKMSFKLGKLSIDLRLLARVLALDPDGSAADREDPARSDQGSALERLKTHRVRVGKILFRPVEFDNRSGQSRTDRLSRSVAFPGEGEGAEQRHFIRVRVRESGPEDLRRPEGTDRVRAGRTVSDFVHALDGFHGESSVENFMDSSTCIIQDRGS